MQKDTPSHDDGGKKAKVVAESFWFGLTHQIEPTLASWNQFQFIRLRWIADRGLSMGPF